MFYRVDNFVFPVNLNPTGCEQPEASPSLLEYICGEQSQDQFSTTYELFKLGGFRLIQGIPKSLLGKKFCTLWAPTNNAFDRLPPGELAFLRAEENFDALNSFLLTHLKNSEYNEDKTMNITSLVDCIDLKCGKTFKICAEIPLVDPVQTITIDTLIE